MKLYVVLTEDRRSDASVEVFKFMDKAHEYAENLARTYSLDGVINISVHDGGENTVYRYSEEASVTVFRKEVEWL